MVCGFRKYLANGLVCAELLDNEKPSQCLEMLNIGWGETKIRRETFHESFMKGSSTNEV